MAPRALHCRGRRHSRSVLSLTPPLAPGWFAPTRLLLTLCPGFPSYLGLITAHPLAHSLRKSHVENSPCCPSLSSDPFPLSMHGALWVENPPSRDSAGEAMTSGSFLCLVRMPKGSPPPHLTSAGLAVLGALPQLSRSGPLGPRMSRRMWDSE